MPNAVKTKKPSSSKISRNRVRQQAAIQYQERLESAILNYQRALADRDSFAIERSYALICELYPPHKHMSDWYNQYYFLYDTAEDFTQEYNMIFCKVLAKWKPRGERRASRHEGSGEFKNYFIGALQNHYSNLVKANNAGKRNVGCRCPICETWVNPLSTHLRKHHVDLLWEQMASFGYDVHTMTECPFCKSHKTPRQVPCEHQENGACETCRFQAANEALKRHLLSKHSTFLFQRFSELYPDHHTMKTKEVSVWTSEDDEGEETCHYDATPGDNRIDHLLSCDLSALERSILEQVLNGSSSITYRPNVYKCTEAEFEMALDTLRDKMTLVGLEG
jgi:hypothetical protein